MVSSERTGMEGKAKAERDSLTQAEEEDTSVQAYCADSCPQRMRADKALVHWASEKITRARRQRSAELIRLLIPNTKKLRNRTRIGSN